MIVGDSNAAAEEVLEFTMITEVTVADDPQTTTFSERGASLAKHAPGDGFVDGTLLVVGRVAEYEIETVFGRVYQAIGDGEGGCAIGESRREICLRCSDSHKGFVCEIQFGAAVARGSD